jgi:hypothetical protein
MAKAASKKITIDPKPKTVMGALKAIDKIVMGLSNLKRRKLWDVLSALRGPDNAAPGVKTSTTALIRYRAFPEWCSESTFPAMASSLDNIVRLKYRRSKLQRCTHFSDHARKAFLALGLEWDKDNGDLDKIETAKSKSATSKGRK